MDLLIVESPTKARTLSKFLPQKQYKILPTVGHIRDLPKSKIGIDVDNDFAIDYEIIRGKKKVVKELAAACATADRIFLATDPDREGEAISWHTLELLKKSKKTKIKDKPVKRVTFHEITQSAVEEALEHAHQINHHMVNAQQARRVVDRLVGYQVSPVLWKKVRRGLSAGRVQSVAVRLIVEKEREREAFPKEEYWDIPVDLNTQDKGFPSDDNPDLNVKLAKINGAKAQLPDIVAAETAMAELAVGEYTVAAITKKETRRSPSAPFTTSTMQQTASSKIGMAAKRTMSVAQKLYEKGLITYHRTDSVNLSHEAIDAVRGFISSKYGANYLPGKPKIYKTKSKSAQEAHEAIRPTDVSKTPESLDLPGGESSLYKLIWGRFVACQMTPAVFDKTELSITSVISDSDPASPSDPSNVYGLTASGLIQKFDGWMRATGTSGKDKILPELSEGQQLFLAQIWGNQRYTEPPTRYSEATLIKTLEELGIGRPSTYASIISTIQDRGYVSKEEDRLVPSVIGTTTNDFLVAQFPTEMDYQFTANMEDDLDEIANGDKEWKKVMSEFYTPFAKDIEKAEEADRVQIPTESTGQKCPKCGETEGGEVVIRTGRFGKFLSCSRYPDCDHTDRLVQKIDMACPDCGAEHGGEVIIKSTRRGKKFYGCSRYPDCKYASWTNPKEGQGSEQSQ